MTAVLDQAHALEKLLLQHSVTVFGYERLDDLAVVRFRMNDKKLRLVVKMPDYSDDKYKFTPERRQIRAASQREALFWGDVTRTWQAMTQLIAAKLNGIEMGITTFEAEFSQFADAEALITSGEKG